MASFFRFDGPLVMFLNKIGNVILASILWLVGCIPVVTVGVSTTALYYTVVKAIRAERGYVATEFWNAYKHSIKKGILFGIFYLAAFAILLLDSIYMGAKGNLQSVVYQYIYMVAGGLLLEIAIYLFPLLSRFALPMRQLAKMALVSVFKFLPYTIGCNVILLLVLVVARYVPLLLPFFLPGAAAYGMSYLLEPVLRYYTPEPETKEEKDAWYYSLSRPSH